MAGGPAGSGDDGHYGPFPKSYFGSKGGAGVAERIIAGFPPHSIYVEGCLGGGAVLRRKPPALWSIGIDLDPAVIARWSDGGAPPGLELRCCCVLGWLGAEGLELPDDALVYLDAPYLHETRRSKHRYRCEFDRADHARMLFLARQLPCSVVISHYDHPMYREALGDWAHEVIPTVVRGGGAAEEHVWRRSSLTSFGGGIRHAGTNYRDRERIKKLVDRWRVRFASMRRDQQRAVLQELLEVERKNWVEGRG